MRITVHINIILTIKIHIVYVLHNILCISMSYYNHNFNSYGSSFQNISYKTNSYISELDYICIISANMIIHIIINITYQN